MNKKKFMIIDGNSILNRAFYGLKLLSNSQGVYTNAVLGFLNIMQKYIKEEEPKYLCVTFDLRAPTFRHKEYSGYKAQRKGMPEELAMQVPLIKEVLDAMNIKRIEVEGFEADDIIGSLSLSAEKQGIDVIVITGDRDSLQLVSDKVRVKIPKTKFGKTETEEYDPDKIREVYGIEPKQFIDVKGLMGDTSDNIPGIAGIGEKTALSLIKQFQTIENLYNNIEQVDKKRIKEKLIEGKDIALLSRRLATIFRDMDVFDNISAFEIKRYNDGRLYEILKKLEFKHLIQKLNLDNLTKNNVEKVERNIIVIKDVISLSELALKISFEKQCYFYHVLNKEDKEEKKLIGFAMVLKSDFYYIDISEIGEKNFLDILKQVFEDKNILKYGHDVKELYTVLFNNDMCMNSLDFDTMIGAYILDPTKNDLSLPVIVQEFLEKEIESFEHIMGKGKSYISFDKLNFDLLCNTAIEYVAMIKELVPVLKEKIAENNQDELYYSIELPLIEVLANLEYWGFKVNQDELKSFSKELDIEILNLKEEIYNLSGEEFNINSPKQLGNILFEKLQLPITKKTKTGYATDAESLERLSIDFTIVKKILYYRQLVKLKSTYAEGLLMEVNKKDGKIHSNFNQTVTATGRISSTEPNLQNIPIKLELGKRVRKAFIPESEEFVLLDADYSQIELRVLAHITQDPNMIEAFINDEDIHSKTASKVFGIPLDEVSPMMRQRAKAVNFGIVYGIGDFSLSKDLGITKNEARQYIESYFEKYEKVRDYMNDVVEKGKEDGYITTIFQRRRYLPELKSSNFNVRSFGKRVAMNTPIQGSAADIIKIAMVRVYNELKNKKLKSRLILQVHDELLIETHITEIETVKAILKDCMENAVKLSVPLTVDTKMGKNWYKAK